MTKELIEDINTQLQNKGMYDQGIFLQPNGIPYNITEPVLYWKWSPGGWSGGGYQDEQTAQPYTNSSKDGEPFEVMDLVLKELCPNISYLKFREIEKALHTNDWCDNEYYGNCTDWEIKYITVSELEKIINKN